MTFTLVNAGSKDKFANSFQSWEKLRLTGMFSNNYSVQGMKDPFSCMVSCNSFKLRGYGDTTAGSTARR